MKANIPLPDFSDGRILVVGDVILDKYCYGTADRVSPEAPVQVVNVDGGMERLGGAANVAANIRELGSEVALIGIVGDDREAQSISQLLDKKGIESRLITTDDSPTIVKLRIISHNQQLLRLDYEDGFPQAAPDVVANALSACINDVDAVLFSDYAKGCLREIERLIGIARDAGKMIFVDPKRRDFTSYSGATVVTPNLKEFTAVVGSCETPAELENKALELCAACDLNAMLITQGEEGMTLVEAGKPAVRFPAEMHEVYDTTGAGDTVISVLAGSVVAGLPLPQAAKLANKAAGIAVMKLGTTVITRDELAGVTAHVEEGAGVLSSDELLTAVKRAREQGESIVMTNGCFDLLHLGHLAYLKKASFLGDRLIVAINSDESVGRLKGEDRPIKDLNERAIMLAALQMVDWVVAFDDDTPLDLIAEVKPDVLVKGGDYRAEEVAGYETVTENGGEVVIIDYIDGYSTSGVIQKIKNQTPQT